MVAGNARAENQPAATTQAVCGQLLFCNRCQAPTRPSIDSDHLVAPQGVWCARQGLSCCPDAWLGLCDDLCTMRARAQLMPLRGYS